MAIITGISGQMKAVTDAGTLALVAEMKSWSVEETQDQVETTVMGDSTKTFLNTIKGWSASCECVYNPSDAAQADLINGAKVQVEFYPAGTSDGTNKFSGDAFVTSVSRSGSMGDLVAISVSLQGDGALTVAMA